VRQSGAHPADSSDVPGEPTLGRPTARMRALREALARVDPFTEPATEAALRSLAEAKGDKPADYIHPLRVALVGTAVSPGIFAVLVLIGRERALRRLDRLVRFIETLPAGGAAGGS